VAARTEFHPLRVAKVEPLTDDSAAVSFDVPDELRHKFAFRPGQSLTIRRGAERRSYSICVPVGRPPRIGVRESRQTPRPPSHCCTATAEPTR
jgi:ring-1,2-phenylacetyl-CoA epoxidase subunit PaaE